MHMASPRVLLVEDDEDSRLLLRRVLERAGMQVVEAASGTQGLRELYGSHPDVVLLDIGPARDRRVAHGSSGSGS